MFSDDHLPDFVGACSDFIQLGIPQIPAHGIVIDIAISAKTLNSLQAHFDSLLAGEVNEGATVAVADFALVHLMTHVVQIGSARLQTDVHIGDLPLHQLKFAQFLPELFASLDVVHAVFHYRLHQTHRTRSQNQSLVVQSTHHHVHTLV